MITFLRMLVLVCAVGILSSCKYKTPEGRVDFVTDRLTSKLDLSDSQKSMLKEIGDHAKQDLNAEKEIRANLKPELIKMLGQPELDQARIKQILKERQARFDSRTDKYLSKVSNLHKTMNPEQKKKLAELVEDYFD